MLTLDPLTTVCPGLLDRILPSFPPASIFYVPASAPWLGTREHSDLAPCMHVHLALSLLSGV